MIRRVLLVVVFVSVLATLLVYSQRRSRSLSVSGFVEADEIRLGSRVGGRVATVHCREGDEVSPGQVLLTLEDFDLAERRAEAEAELAARQAELEKVEHGFRPEEIGQAKARVARLEAVLKKLRAGAREEEIRAAEARVEWAEAQRERAQRSYQRLADLFRQETGAVAREDLDRATEDLAVAEKNLEVRRQELQLLLKGTRAEDIAAAEAELEEARQALLLMERGYRREERDQAKAAVEAAKAALDVIDAQIEELQITSPVTGVVQAIELQPGDLVAAGAPALSLLDTRHLWVRAYVPEDQLWIKVGEPVTVAVDSYPGRSFKGHVSFIAYQAEFTPNNVQTPEERSKQVFRIKVTLDEGQDVLRPGMPADIPLRAPQP